MINFAILIDMRASLTLLLFLLSFGCAAEVSKREVIIAEKTNISTPPPAQISVINASFDKPQDWLATDAKEILKNADRIELISVNFLGMEFHPAHLSAVSNLKHKIESDRNNKFYGCEVLGRTEINDKQTKKELVEALFDGTSNISAGESSMCFQPRHGIKAIYRGKVAKLLICFECQNFYSYTNKGQILGHIRKGFQEKFDRILKAANVPLANEVISRRAAN